MPRINEQCRQRILDAADVHDVIGEFVQLKRRGTGYEACCPFHNERTPSFKVNVSRNIWKCFSCGKGGDAVAFLMEHQGMTYPQALEWIARKFNIELRYDAHEMTDEQKNRERHRESLFAAINAMQEFFVEQFNASTPEAAAARAYAYGRWGEDFCREYGIGYAPKGSMPFMEAMKSRCVEETFLVEMGYVAVNEESKSKYAQFRDRLMIPIRDRMGRVCAYTARRMNDNSDIAKYINSCNSAVFTKENCVFGLRDAVRNARLAKQFLLVEGGPDVLKLHSLGITNTVAALGTAWTESHFQQLKGIAQSVCFIPDSDPAKDGEFGAGFKAVFRAGEIALSLGMEVWVKEIPSDGEKADPDSFISSREVLAGLEEQNFVLWYARKLFGRNLPPSAQRESVQTVSRLVALIDDKITHDSILSALPDIHGKSKLWKDAVKEAGMRRKKAAEEAASTDLSFEEKTMRRFGIIAQKGKYYVAGKDEQLLRISNFTLTPIFHIKSQDNAIRIFRIVNEFGDEDAIELRQEELVSLPRFMKRIENLGRFMWLGKGEHLNQLKEYLYAITRTCEQVTMLGWNPENEFFAFGNGIFTGDSWIEVDELGLVNYANKTFYLPAFSDMHRHNQAAFRFERDFIHRPDSAISMNEFLNKIIAVFGDNAKVGFAFVIAALFRDIIYPIKDSFPILNLFGPPNSGKTALATSLMSLLHPVSEPPKLFNTTIPSINMMLSRAVNTVEVLDEYKNDLDDRKIELLKGIWGGKGQVKMDIETKKIVDTDISCSVIICGQEQPTKDSALFTRVIYLTYMRSEFSQEERTRFRELKELTHRRNSHITLELLRLRPHFEKRFHENYGACCDEITDKLAGVSVKDRIFDNWLIPLAAFRTVETLIDVPFSYRDLFDITLRGMKCQDAMVKKKSEIADFWKLFAALYKNGKLIDGSHFRIRNCRRFKPLGKGAREMDFGVQKLVLYVDYDAVVQVLSSKSGIGAMGAKVDLNTLESYLTMSAQYIGKQQVRLVDLNTQGMPNVAYESSASGAQQKVTMGIRRTAMCFDYAHMQSEFDISLESIKMTEAEALAEEMDEDDTPPQTPQQKPASPQLPF